MLNTHNMHTIYFDYDPYYVDDGTSDGGSHRTGDGWVGIILPLDRYILEEGKSEGKGQLNALNSRKRENECIKKICHLRLFERNKEWLCKNHNSRWNNFSLNKV